MLLFEPLLPPKPSASAATAAAATSFSARRPLFQAPDLLSLKKRGQGARSWIRVDAATGQSQVIEVDKSTMMRRCDLPARDLRLLDPLCLPLHSAVAITDRFRTELFPRISGVYELGFLGRKSKMESDEDNNGFEIDSSPGALVWVRRRNGSWWPGQVLGIDELPEICLNMPKSGTPIKLLGKEDGSVLKLSWLPGNQRKTRHCTTVLLRIFDYSIPESTRRVSCPMLYLKTPARAIWFA